MYTICPLIVIFSIQVYRFQSVKFSKIPQGDLASSLVSIPKMAHFFSGCIWEDVLKQSIYFLIHFRIMKYMMFFLPGIKC